MVGPHKKESGGEEKKKKHRIEEHVFKDQGCKTFTPGTQKDMDV